MILTIGGIIIPLITMIVLFVYAKERVTWFEYFIPLMISLILTISLKALLGWKSSVDIEYWTNYVEQIVHVEDWNESVIYTVLVTDSKGNSHVETRSRIDYYPELFYLCTNQNIEKIISKETYNRIRNVWGKNNEQFIDMHRSYYTNDGDKYIVRYPKEQRMFTLTTKHTYTNKVAANSDSVFKFEKINKNEWNIVDYPDEIGIDTSSILGNYLGTKTEIYNLSVLNAKYGESKKIKIWYVIWNGDESISTAYAQENYWQGGNKNEFVVCIGINQDRTIKWGHVFSWSDKSAMKIQLRNKIVSDIGIPIDLNVYTDWIEENIDLWEKKDFNDFNYLTIPLPIWAYIVIYVSSIFASICSGAYVVLNGIIPEEYGDIL